MAPSHVARLRLLALCVAVAGQAAAVEAVSYQTLRLLQNGNYDAYRPGTLAAWLGLSAVPALILAPFVGPLAGSRWNRAVRISGCALVAAVLAWATATPDTPWLSVAGLLALVLAFFGSAVGSLTTATGLRPTTVRVALVLSAAVGVWLSAVCHYPLGAHTPSVALGFAVVSLIGVLMANVPPAEPVSLAAGLVKPFLAGVRDAVAHRRARHALVGLWLWSFVALSAAVALVRIDGPATPVARPEDRPELWIFASPSGTHVLTIRLLLGIVAGVLITVLNRHPYRHAGFVPYAALLVFGALLGLRLGESSAWPLPALGLALGLAVSPLVNFYLTWTSPKHHGVAAALVVAGSCAAALILAAVLVKLADNPAATRTPLLNVLLAVSALAFVASFAVFFRPAMELTLEALLGPVYRIRGVGPGLQQMPACGPYLVIGNHAAWFDPLYFAKIVQAPIVPMMTSKFYDLPVIAWLMRHVIGTIRVPDKPIRHEAPELQEAVAALDRGECVVLFPEGYLRRKEEVPLRRFGRGVWQILKDRPQTPVFACWIEGTWGSYFSFRGGPPTKGKRPDFWRSIRIGVLGPITVDAATLTDHMATRTFLMQQVSEARRALGLGPLALPTVHDGEGDKE